MTVFIASSDSFVHKSMINKGSGSTIFRPSIITGYASRKGSGYSRIQVFVLIMPGKDNNSIRTFHRIIKVLQNRNSGIRLDIGIMNIYRCTCLDQEIAVRFCRSVPCIIRIGKECPAKNCHLCTCWRSPDRFRASRVRWNI